jgi:hypothetical protein
MKEKAGQARSLSSGIDGDLACTADRKNGRGRGTTFDPLRLDIEVAQVQESLEGLHFDRQNKDSLRRAMTSHVQR